MAVNRFYAYAVPYVYIAPPEMRKIIAMRNGRVKDFRLNTQCSAGNGYFLQAIARTFGIAVESFAEAAFSAAEMPIFGHGCVLFLQSEIGEVQRRGWADRVLLPGFRDDLARILPAIDEASRSVSAIPS